MKANGCQMIDTDPANVVGGASACSVHFRSRADNHFGIPMEDVEDPKGE
jgi:hypothetical protein